MSVAEIGRMIVLDGFEGVGKTTQVKRLAEKIRERGFEVVTLREPGGTASNERIRQVIIEHGATMPVEAQVCLFVACKRNLLVNEILPAIRRGATVLLDRYTPSLVAYQTTQGSVSRHDIQMVLEAMHCDYDPALFLWLDAPIETVQDRLMERNGGQRASDAFEDTALQRAGWIIDAYRDYFDYMENRHDATFRINANQSIEKVSEDIWMKLIQTFPIYSRTIPPASEVRHA